MMFILLNFVLIFGRRFTEGDDVIMKNCQNRARGQALLRAHLRPRTGHARIVVDQFLTRLAGSVSLY
jgi:hypothetical protein